MTFTKVNLYADNAKHVVNLFGSTKIYLPKNGRPNTSTFIQGDHSAPSLAVFL